MKRHTKFFDFLKNRKSKFWKIEKIEIPESIARCSVGNSKIMYVAESCVCAVRVYHSFSGAGVPCETDVVPSALWVYPAHVLSNCAALIVVGWDWLLRSISSLTSCYCATSLNS